MAIKGACKAAGIPPFTPGRFRHSVATWAIEKGADPASVAAFLNHKSPATTRRFYATHAVPAKIPTLWLRAPRTAVSQPLKDLWSSGEVD